MNSLLGRLLLVVAVAVLPALAFQAYTEEQARHARQQLLEDDALRLVRLVAAEQQRIIEGAEQMLTVLGAAPSVRDSLPGLCKQYLTSLEQDAPRYGALAVIGVDGRPVCASIPYSADADLSDDAGFAKALRTGGFVVGDYALGRLSEQPALPFARPFRRSDGSAGGVIVAELSLAWLGEQLRILPLPNAASVTVADRSGRILARHPDGKVFAGTLLPGRNLHVLEDTRPAVGPYVAVDGRPRIVAFIPPALGPGGLYVSVGLDPKAVLKPNDRANRIGIILIAAGAVFALMLTAMLGTRLIRRPVKRLLRAADAWRTGDLAARTGLRIDSTEFGRLAGAFEAMADALQAREQALRDALESTSDAVISLDPDWRVAYLNPRAELQFGRGRDLPGQVLWTALPELFCTTFGDACRKVKETGGPVHAEAWYVSLGSQWEIHAYPSAGGVTVFSRDVTEQRRVSAALRDSEERLRMAIGAARLGVRDFDVAADTVVWSPEAEHIFGREYVSCTNFKAAIAHVHPDDQLMVKTAWKRASEGIGNDYQIEYRIADPNGDWRWVCVYGRGVFEAGRIVRLIAVVQDIDARKRTEAELIRTTALLRAIGNSSAESLYARDTEGRFLYVNPAKLAVIGKPPEEVIGRTVADIHANPVQAAATMANDRRIRETGRTEIIEEEFDAVGPGKRVFRSAKSPLRLEDGTVIGIVGVSSDITGLRVLSAGLEARVQEEVAAREAAQARAAHAERMQALGQLAGGIAHDFNNVLQAVAGAMALIGRRPEDQDGIRRLIRLAGEATERGAAITRRLLAFGRRGDLRAEAIDAAALLTDLREILVHTLGAGIDVQLRFGGDVPRFVADKSQLETSLINLATNARDAMPRGGRLVLSVAAEAVRPALGRACGLDPGRYIRFSVEDTGSGMDAATLARACEPFFTTKTVGAGSGLGLPMAKGFAEQSGGGMHIESAPGQGTTVTLWFPEATVEAAAPAAAAPAAPAAEPEPAGEARCARVLLVDDEDAVREVLTMQLEDFGFAVLPAGGGAEALALLAADEAADILVTDLSMPGMDGLALIRAAQELRRGLPALLLTGYAGDGAALALGGAVSGSFSLLRKPVSAPHLVDRLRSLLAHRREGERTEPAQGSLQTIRG